MRMVVLLSRRHRLFAAAAGWKVPGVELFLFDSPSEALAKLSLGHSAVFVFDTFKWSGGRFNGGAFAGHLAGPLVLAGITGVGRSVGDYESFGQVLVGGTIGLGVGFLSGLTYSLMQRPECGYTGSLICW